MTQLLFPDAGSRWAVKADGSPATSTSFTVYEAETGGSPATIYADTSGTPGAAITGGVVVTDSRGFLPLWWGRDVDPPIDRLWVTDGVGPRWPVDADANHRTDLLTARVAAIEPGGSAVALRAAQNLADLASATAARTNLGLGNAATRSVGATTGTVAAGDDSRLSDARTPTTHATSHSSGGSDQVTVAQSQVTGLTTALAAKVAKGDHVIDVRDYGVVGDGTTDDTAALQAAIDAASAAEQTLRLADGVYRHTGLTLPDGTSIAGPRTARHNFANAVGSAAWLESARMSGAWLKMSGTSGAALNIAAGARTKLVDVGLVGPGSGTATGIRATSSTARHHWTGVWVCNFGGKAVEMTEMYFSLVQGLVVRGCAQGIHLVGPSNQNTFVQTELWWCSDYALRISDSDTNLFLGGVTEVNNGTVVFIEDSRATTFDGWYFEDIQSTWPSPSTYTFRADALSGNTVIRNSHFSGALAGPVLIEGNYCSIAFPLAAPAVTVNGSGGMFVGTFPAGITEGTPGANTIIDGASGVAKLPGDRFLELDSKLYLGPSASYGNWLWRIPSTGDTELASAHSNMVRFGSGSPEGAVTASPSSLYLRRDVGQAVLKRTGTGSSGWRALAADIAVDVRDYGAVGDGTADDTAALQAAIDAAVGGTVAAGASAVRVATKRLYVPKGTYKITAPLKVYSVQGFEMFGDGEESILAVSGALAYALDVAGSYGGNVHDLTVTGKTTADTATTVIGLNRDLAKALATCTFNRFTGITIRNLKYVNGFGLGESSGALQVDNITITHCVLAGQWSSGETTWWQTGFLSGSGTNANVLNHVYVGCHPFYHRQNWHANACNITILGGGCGYAEIDVLQSGSRTVSVTGVRSETSQRLFSQAGGAAFAASATLRDIMWDANAINADKRWIRVQYGGSVILDNLTCGVAEAAPVIWVNNSSTKVAHITATGLTTRNALAAAFASAGSSSPAHVTVRGYTRIDAAGEPTESTQSWARTLSGTVVGEAVLGPAQGPDAADHGWLGWSLPLHAATGSTAIATAGTLQLVRVRRVRPGTITNIVVYVSVAGSALTSGQCFAAAYTAAGALLGTTADQATAWASTGLKTMALTVPATHVGGDLYVGFWFNGTTGPALLRSGQAAAAIINANLSAPNLAYATADTGLTTTAPATFGTQTSSSPQWWVAVS